eukprot:1580334-Pyramimonas_sp.AAC.1
MEACPLNGPSMADCADGEDDSGSALLLETELLSIPSVRSKHRRRKTMQAARQQHEEGVECQARDVTPILHHKD